MFLSTNIAALFGLSASFATLAFFAPLVEEASKASIIAIGSRRFYVMSLPWSHAVALAFGLGFGALEFLLKWPPDGVQFVDMPGRLAPAVLHMFLALVLVSYANAARLIFGIAAAALWHIVNNSWVLLCVEYGWIGPTEGVIRLFVILGLFVFALPLIRRQRPE